MMQAHAAGLSRNAVLRALGVTPLRLRFAEPSRDSDPILGATDAAPMADAGARRFDRRIALAPSREETDRPELSALYAKIGEAVASLGLQCVRLADAESDPRVRVLAFGDVALPPDIAAERVLRVDALAVLQTDRERKRGLWDALQRLPQDGA